MFWDCERASGFTLLEAMAALLLIGALSAVAIPGMVRWL
ncbi:MAG TPA: prepilin-type N-terminal cleavage/methylation domain-containing protein, partial [Alicyclobacillus sp.]|nr:prepilin-type N-terminal cleavage/methylation domain-containing protein [Alicyclobacillus sp.]